MRIGPGTRLAHYEIAAVLLVLALAGHTIAEAQSIERRRPVRRPEVEPRPRVVNVGDDFRSGRHGWFAGFADYSPVNQGMDLVAGLRPLPEELEIDGTGLLIAGTNVSDDLFMFFAKRLDTSDGIFPDQAYAIDYTITFASNVGEGCVGIGGSPGDSVYLKAGASTEEPRVVLDESDNHFRMTVDKGNQSVGGPAASVVGTIANGTSNCHDDAPFMSLTRHHRHDETVRSDPAGALWLLMGTDSGYEGRTTLYYQSVRVRLQPMSHADATVRP